MAEMMGLGMHELVADWVLPPMLLAMAFLKLGVRDTARRLDEDVLCWSEADDVSPGRVRLAPGPPLPLPNGSVLVGEGGCGTSVRMRSELAVDSGLGWYR
jgi:hypothetical protein